MIFYIPVIERKPCKKCLSLLENTSEYFTSRKGKLTNTCKPCYAAYAREYRSKNHDKTLQQRRDRYHKDIEKSRQKAREKYRNMTPEQKKRATEAKRKWEAANKESVRENARKRARAWYNKHKRK